MIPMPKFPTTKSLITFHILPLLASTLGEGNDVIMVPKVMTRHPDHPGYADPFCECVAGVAGI